MNAPHPAGIAAVVGCLGLLAPAPADANRAGISGRAEIGCGGGGCHAGGDAPTVALIGPSTVAPGAVSDFVLRISGGQSAAGANIQASAGLLVPGEGLVSRAGQLLHNGDARGYTDGAAEFSFQWEAPDAPGVVDLFAAGNSVNNNFQATGDNWALASATITVGDGVAPDAGPPADAAPDDGGGGGGDSGCGQGPGGPTGGGFLALLILGGLVLRRR